MNKIKKCAGMESFQRMNYLYQICNAMATQSKASHRASVQYSNLMINISKKAVQRLDVEIKRTICKGCRSLLLPGITCKVRIKKKKLLHHCLLCSTTKVFPCKNKDYKLWVENPSVVECLDYSLDRNNQQQTSDNKKIGHSVKQ
ncbi:ribonuclease P protein subunit rpr2-like [Sitophilus oryzae]|uniref:Ribonuclease P protein subunit rpr2-like n=1 Tax=Sitophilus oryzae TaxID=7048 RepID=A0A6J2YAB0_SITOR|nr:ribonuclease P protein subunit rpr2-like [Sitophilus oryzae]